MQYVVNVKMRNWVAKIPAAKLLILFMLLVVSEVSGN